jgi:hypothetical protein
VIDASAMAVVNSVDQLLEILPRVVLLEPPARSLTTERREIKHIILKGYPEILTKILFTHDLVEKFATGDKLHHYVYLGLAGHHLHKVHTTIRGRHGHVYLVKGKRLISGGERMNKLFSF